MIILKEYLAELTMCNVYGQLVTSVLAEAWEYSADFSS